MTGRVALLCWAAAACLDAPPSSTGPGDGDGGAPFLLAAYRFEAEPGFLADSSGNGNDGDCADPTCPESTVARDDVGGAALFDGVDDIVSIAGLAAAAGPVTVMTWLRLDRETGTALGCAVNKPIGGTVRNSWQLCLRIGAPGTADVRFYTSNDPGFQLNTAVPMEAGTWHHAAIRWDGGEKTLWWDGAVIASVEATTRFDELAVLVGSDRDGEQTAAPFPGALDDVEVYQGALADAEIAAAAGM